ncbi:hypothetical protein [Aureimonas sp. AU4]|uniref:hypothetical protein n=1 Tax=Aureimonas sp. AU4 TaxID=1638163 RepID=UPI000706972E|nr:hypothetical protein [Aureimonas sp. AU4]BAT30427.1 VCBS domain protein fragment [Aureimonas sp. AU4]
MSNIESNIIDPREPAPPDSIVPPRDHVGSDEVREPGRSSPPIERDPEEGGRTPDDIERALDHTPILPVPA